MGGGAVLGKGWCWVLMVGCGGIEPIVKQFDPVL